MSGKRVNGRPNDMPPERLCTRKRTDAKTIGQRYLPRNTKLNETGKLEWLYRRTYQHGRHSITQ